MEIYLIIFAVARIFLLLARILHAHGLADNAMLPL